MKLDEYDAVKVVFGLNYLSPVSFLCSGILILLQICCCSSKLFYLILTETP